jgi:hypothetical protein
MATYYNPPIVTDSLIVHYDVADEGCWPQSGSTIFDLATNKVNGDTFNCSMSASKDYCRGSVLTMDGTNSYVQFSGVDLDNDPFTEEAWVYLQGWDNSASYLIYSDNAGGNPLTGLQIASGDGDPPYENKFSGVIRDDGGTLAYASSSTAPANDTWYHLAFVRAGAANSNTFQLYVNGKLECNMTGASAADVDAADGIGGDRIGGNPEGNKSWSGSIGPFRIYNRALSENEVLQNFNAQRSRFGL